MSEIADASNLLRDAISITFVVHGVGDHRATDILSMAELGLWPQLKSLQDDNVQSNRVTLRELPRPPAYTPDFEYFSPIPGRDPVATYLQTADGYHFAVPVVWSGIRPRLTDRTRYINVGLNPMKLVDRALPALWETCVDAFRCIRHAPAIVARVEVVLLALAYLALTVGLYLGILFATSHLVFWWAGTDKSHQVSWPAWLLFIAVLLFMRTSIMQAFSLWDFIGDVISYVGHPGRRKAVEKTMREIIGKGAALAPRAKLIVIGHSLGSVLVTHSLLDPHMSNNSGGRTVVVTMGSPLRCLAHLFPGAIKSPTELAHLYQGSLNAVGWVNLWRDADAIGRDLRPEPAPPLFAETSLGDGTHVDYWRDLRFWNRIAQVILRSTGEQQVPLAASICAGGELTEDEEMQVLAQKPGAYIAVVLQTILGGILLWTTASYTFGSGQLVKECAWIAFAAATAVGVATTLPEAWARGEPRQRLAQIRWWRPWRLLAGRVWVVSVFTLLFAVWWITE